MDNETKVNVNEDDGTLTLTSLSCSYLSIFSSDMSTSSSHDGVAVDIIYDSRNDDNGIAMSRVLDRIMCCHVK